jgi:hypothetical protein
MRRRSLVLGCSGHAVHRHTSQRILECGPLHRSALPIRALVSMRRCVTIATYAEGRLARACQLATERPSTMATVTTVAHLVTWTDVCIRCTFPGRGSARRTGIGAAHGPAGWQGTEPGTWSMPAGAVPADPPASACRRARRLRSIGRRTVPDRSAASRRRGGTRPATPPPARSRRPAGGRTPLPPKANELPEAPSALEYRQAIQVRTEPGFRDDIGRLVRYIQDHFSGTCR